MYATGRIRKDSKMQHTALYAGKAMADAALVPSLRGSGPVLAPLS